MQVLNSYFSIHSRLYKHTLSLAKETMPLSNPPVTNAFTGRLANMRAHFSQLSAWINFTGIFIVLHLCTLVIISASLLINTNINLPLLLTPLYIVYASYALFLGRRLWAYGHDREPLDQQMNSDHNSRIETSRVSTSNVHNSSMNDVSVSKKLRAWALHLNFWELGALSWLPVLWGRDKPFICTPKQEVVSTRRTLWLANISALPKLLLILNLITAVVVSPFSMLYSPVLFICAITVCLLKLWAARVMFNNYAYVETHDIYVEPSKTTVANQAIEPLKAAHRSAQNSAAKITVKALAATSENKDVVNS